MIEYACAYSFLKYERSENEHNGMKRLHILVHVHEIRIKYVASLCV